ncbi:TnsA endonuclease C-terminal domain-containing protein [Thiomicrorhabdus cannonii]|uniref:TnsA endonuclease C-terminal domain-containing protein n=1 Tax=Thiomicrorhabdus cannonii TaxID=2748011 RepID=UPI0015BDC1A5|nr:TnsA endonuclease C-terminal domain-containing protein [Thiomicrorhabdus cannonii]
MKPARIIPRSYRNITGKLASKKTEGYTNFESGIEYGALVLCEYSHDIETFHAQPRRFNYFFNGKHRHYTPDIFVQYKNGLKLYVEVKYRSYLRENWDELKPKFKAAIHELKSEPNTYFKIWTEKEIDTTYLENAKFLLPYRHRDFEAEHPDLIFNELSQQNNIPVKTLLNKLSNSRLVQAEFLNTIWSLVSNNQIKIDLSQPLNMQSLLWIET